MEDRKTTGESKRIDRKKDCDKNSRRETKTDKQIFMQMREENKTNNELYFLFLSEFQ